MIIKKSINVLYYKKKRRYKAVKTIYLKGKFQNIIECAKIFDLNYRNFINRIKSEVFKSTRRAINQRFTKIQKLILLKYMRKANDQYMFLNFKNITAAVNYIIQKNNKFAFFFNDN